VEVIAHQAVGMNRVSESIHPVRQKPKKFPPIFIIDENRRPRVAESHHMVQAPNPIQPRLPCQAASLQVFTQLRKPDPMPSTL